MSTDVGGQTTGQTESALGVDMNLEVVTLPVADVDRAKAFYQSLGWRLDIDLVLSDEVRNVQFTPPHSGCSIQFGRNLFGAKVTSGAPGSTQGLYLIVSDIEAARNDLVAHGIEWKRLAQNSLVDGDDVETMAGLDQLGQNSAGAEPEQHALEFRYGFAATDLSEIAVLLSGRAVGQLARHAGEPVRLGQELR